MTERLYYTEAYLQTFDAAVTRVDVVGGRTSVVLDRTAFYPTSGGQPFDTGVLIGETRLQVVDVVDDDSGDVAHIVDSRPETVTPGQSLRGSVDWPRRFDHMQQHTGQHVLSAAIDRLFGVRTVSFHLGAESSTIDVSRELTRDELVSAEVEANAVVFEDRPVEVRFVSAEEAASLPLRKEPVREGTLRLVDIDRFDLSACGGTHVARTGGIGVIAIGSVERFKSGQRIEFFCGGRALTKFRGMRDALAGTVRLLSVAAHELPQAIEKLQLESRDRQRSMLSLQQELARYRAEELAASAEQLPTGRLVLRAVDADAAGLKSMASAIAARPGFIAVLVSTATPALVVVARSEDVNVAANQVIATLTAKFGGRGGGKPDLAQAGNLAAESATILDAARGAIA
jgi:alanyl-tRNA synthetase